MATTTHTFPTYIGISRKAQRTLPRYGEAEPVQIVAGFDWLLLFLQCPRHEWTWPRTNKQERFHGFDAHQTCFKCSSKRFFNSRTWQSGPLSKPPF